MTRVSELRISFSGQAQSGGGGKNFQEKLRRRFYLCMSGQFCFNQRVIDVIAQLEEFLRRKPVLGKEVYIARGAMVLGDVTLGDHSSVWYNAVVRGDINRILIGRRTNIQDNAVIHLADEFPCMIGSDVTVGHSAIVHACTVVDETLI